MERMTDEELKVLEDILRQRGETVSGAESCTGGMIAARLTDIPGSSDVFKRSFVTYCDEAKNEMLGVRTATLEKYTAVSSQTAIEMAMGAAVHGKADIAYAVTGYAGPGDPDDPLNGLVYTAVCYHGRTETAENHFQGSRREVREQAEEKVLHMLKDKLADI